MVAELDAARLTDALAGLRTALHAARLPLATPGALAGEGVRAELEGQIGDYLLPRLRQMDAPLLMVVGGSTGAGKSTLVNSLLGEDVSAAGVLRPTTRAPVLACHPADVRWFSDDRILPGLARTTGGAAGPGGLALVPTERLPEGLALLDAPDIDSVVEANRALAGQLLAAADSWLFVTTAARYADAVPWDLLAAARERGTALSLVLDRVPPEAADEIAAHLRAMLEERGLGATPVLVVPEATLEAGRLPAAALAPVRGWLDRARRRRPGARRARAPHAHRRAREHPGPRGGRARRARRAGGRRRRRCAAPWTARTPIALDEVDETIRSGALLRGEVLARWHDVVGTGDIMRALETRIGRLRDRLRSLVTGAPAAEEELRTAVQVGVDAVVLAAADRAAEQAAGAWRVGGAGARRCSTAPGGSTPPRPTSRRARASRSAPGRARCWSWSGPRAPASATTARLASLGVNGAGLTVMIAVFASTGGLTGAEVVVAGGTSALGQKVLEAIFGDQAVRTLAARAREHLHGAGAARCSTRRRARFHRVLEPLAPPRRRARGRSTTRWPRWSAPGERRGPRPPARRAGGGGGAGARAARPGRGRGGRGRRRPGGRAARARRRGHRRRARRPDRRGQVVALQRARRRRAGARGPPAADHLRDDRGDLGRRRRPAARLARRQAAPPAGGRRRGARAPRPARLRLRGRAPTARRSSGSSRSPT